MPGLQGERILDDIEPDGRTTVYYRLRSGQLQRIEVWTPANLRSIETNYISENTTGAYVLNVNLAGGIGLYFPTLQWIETSSAPNLTQAARTTDAATHDFNIFAQGPWVSATGTNRNSGSVTISTLPAAAGGEHGVVRLRAASTDVLTASTTAVTLNVPAVTFEKAVSAPTFSQTAPSTDVATSDMTVQSQTPYASATGSNRNSGNFIVQTPAPAAGGTAGSISFRPSATEAANINTTDLTLAIPHIYFTKATPAPTIKQSGQTTDTPAFDLMVVAQAPWASATGTNRNSGSLVLSTQAATAGGAAGAVKIIAGGLNTFKYDGANATFGYDIAAPKIGQDIQIADAATTDLTITAQAPWASATGTNRNSGSLVLGTTAPVSGGVAGSVQLKPGDAVAATVTGNSIFIADTLAAPSGATAGGGHLFVESGVLKFLGVAGVVKTVAFV